MKKLMLDHAFKFVETVIFHIGDKNIRSQKAIEKLGARKVDEMMIYAPNDNDNLKFIYEMNKITWTKIQNKK